MKNFVVLLIALLALGFGYSANEMFILREVVGDKNKEISSLKDAEFQFRADISGLEFDLERATSMLVIDEVGVIGLKYEFFVDNGIKQIAEGMYLVPGWGLILQNRETGDLIHIESFRGEVVTLLPDPTTESQLRFKACDEGSTYCRVADGIAILIPVDERG